MKFSCPKCTTRYTIADSKVPAGKTLRFTCKKCSHVFRLRKKEQPQAAGPLPVGEFSDSTQVASVNEILALKKRSKDEERQALSTGAHAAPAAPGVTDWYVLLAGQQKGPFDAGAIGEMLDAGEVTGRTYAWREGMVDWARVGQIEQFRDLAESPKLSSATPQANQESAREPGTMGDVATVAMNVKQLEHELEKARASDAEASSGFAGAVSPFDEEDGDLTVPGDPFLPEALPVHPDPSDAEEMRRAQSAPDIPQLQVKGPAPGSDYLQAPPGEATRVFMTTAGIYRRKRNHRIAAVVGFVVLLMLSTIVGLDLAGIWTIPGMGLMYDMTGFEDPNAERAIARTEEKLQEDDLTPEEREQLRKRQEALRAKLMGGGGSKGRVRRTRGRGRGKEEDEKLAEANIGIEEKQPADADQDEQAIAAAIFNDSRKKERTPVLRPPSELQTPNLPDGLTRESIFKIINENQRAMSLCISQSMKAGEKLTGKMEVELTISAKGRVTSAAIGTARFKTSTMGTCAVKTVKRWRFPRFNGEPVTVIFPYVLSAGF